MPLPALVLAQQGADQAADNLSVSNAVSSLRSIGDADWASLISNSSSLMQLMLTQPVFAAEDNPTRDQTLHRIEALAKQTGRSEAALAYILVGLMQGAAEPANSDDSTDSADLRRTPQHWLWGAGRAEFMRSIGAKANLPWPRRWAWGWKGLSHASSQRQGVTLFLYAAALMLGTMGVLLWAEWPSLKASGWTGFGALAPMLMLLMLLPASEAVVAVINRLISESVTPRRLPRLAFASGLPAEHRVLVVIPAMLTDSRAIRNLVHRLHLHHLANPELHAQFALLTDWANGASASGEPGCEWHVSRSAWPV